MDGWIDRQVDRDKDRDFLALSDDGSRSNDNPVAVNGQTQCYCLSF